MKRQGWLRGRRHLAQSVSLSLVFGVCITAVAFALLAKAESDDSFVDQFRNLVNTQPFASDAQWRDFGRSLPENAFQQLRTFLETESDVHTQLGVQQAFVIFTQESSSFRSDLAKYALTTLQPGRVSRESRVVLSCFVKYCERNTQTTDELVFEALTRHRSYREPPPIQDSLGADIRSSLGTVSANLKGQHPRVFILPFSYSLSVEQRLTDDALRNWDGTSRNTIERWDVSFREGLLRKISEPQTIEAINWTDTTDGPQNGQQDRSYLLTVVQRSLLEAYDDASLTPLRDATSNALLRHLQRTFSLWSDTFKSWHWEPSKRTGFNPDQAYNAEFQLRAAIVRLDGFMAKDLVAQYIRLTDLYGGWRAGQPQGEGPTPYWIKDWQGASRTARGLSLAEAIAPEAFIRWSRKLVWIEDGGNEVQHEFQDLTNAEYLYQLVAQLKLNEIGSGQGILPDIDFRGNLLPAPINVTSRQEFILPRATHSRASFNTPLHEDQKRALRLVLAEFYLWRADIEYRNLGPKGVGESLDEPGKTKAESFFKAALQLLSGAEGEWSVGLGLFSRVLDLEKEMMLDEYKLLTAQLAQGQDYYGESAAWPVRYAWELRSDLLPILTYIQQLESNQERSFRKNDLEINVKVTTEGLKRAEALLASANNLIAAGETTLNALQKEVDQQRLRVGIAEIRQRESNWLVEAHKRAREAQNNAAQAERILEESDQFALLLVTEQINTLKTNIGDLQGQIPNLRRDIEAAQKQIPQFKNRAVELHRDVQSRKQLRALFISIIKTVARAVSIYYTGVDLVSVADSAYGAYKAADSGDWATSFDYAYKAANTASNGDLQKELQKYPDLAQKYVNSSMSDSFTEAANAIKQATGLNDNDALAQATKAIGRQALRFGVSYLALNTNVRQVAEKLGVNTLTDQQILDINRQAKNEALNAAYQAVAIQGEQVLTAAREALQCRDCTEAILKDRLSMRIFDGEVEQQIVTFISELKQRAPQADVTALKLQLVRAQKNLLNIISAKTGIDPAVVEAVVDDLIKKKLDPEGKLPPIPLPREVIDLLHDFKLEVLKARSSIAFITSEEQQNKVIDQLSEIEDDKQFDEELNGVMNQLNTGMGNAVNSMNQAARSLVNLTNELNRLTIEQRQTQYKSKAQEWRRKAAERLQDYETALLDASNESLLAAHQQKKIEDLGVEIALDRQQSQRLANSSRVNERDAAKASARIAELERDRARNQLSHWYLFNAVPAVDERVRSEQARLFYVNYVNSKFVQLWRLVNAYEFDFSKLPDASGDSRPSYQYPTLSQLNNYMATYKAAESHWDIERPEDYPVLSSYPVDDLAQALPPNVADKIRSSFIRNGGSLQRPLILEGEQDLDRLRKGLHFRIRSLDKNLGPKSPTQSALSASGQLRGKHDLQWNDTGAYRLRLLGVILIIESQSLREGTPPVLTLAQNGDGWIVIENAKRQKQAFMLPIPPMEQFLRGSISRRGFETRPLFASYTLKIDETNFNLIDPKRFKAKVHFVAVGVPGGAPR